MGVEFHRQEIAKLLAGMLKIYPLLTVENGKIDVYDKVRTLSKAYQRGIEAVTKDIDPNDYEWMIIHAYNETECLKLKSSLKRLSIVRYRYVSSRL